MSFRKDPQPLWPIENSGILPCPFLGFFDDPEVHYSYPEAGNCCHRVKHAQPVNRQQQSEVCLAGKYQNCPVYSMNWNGPLPRELTGKDNLDRSEHGFNKGWLFLCAGVVLLALIGLSLNFLWPAKPLPTIIPISIQLTPFQALLPSLAPQTDPTFTATLPIPTTSVVTETIPPSPLSPTTTISPTTEPPTPGPLQETPFGPSGRYLVHVVQEGEVMETIAARYSTTVDVLLAVNQSSRWPLLWGGWPAVIVVGETDPRNVFAMQAVWLAQPMRVDVLAAKYATSENELRSFNGLGHGDTVPGGRWIVARK